MILQSTNKSYIRAAEYLNDGKVIVVPGTTHYSIATNAANYESVRRLYEIKQRSLAKPLTLLVPAYEALKYIAIPEDNKKALLFVGDPVVLIGKVGKGLKFIKNINQSTQTLGISFLNIMAHRMLYEYSSVPIAGTSLNISGQPVVTRFDEAVQAFGDQVDLILDAGNLPDGINIPTVLDISNTPALLLRNGAVDEHLIRAILPDLQVAEHVETLSL